MALGNHQRRSQSRRRQRGRVRGVGDVVGQLAHHAVLKVAAAQEGKSRTRQARKELSDQLRTIMRTAELLARTSAGIDEPFRLPPYRSDRTLLAAGGGFVEYATPIAAQFVERGLPATFLADLEAARKKLGTAIPTARQAHDRSAANATVRITMLAGAAVHALTSSSPMYCRTSGDDGGVEDVSVASAR
jgi:hypothetical protein